jgi:peptidoglycan/LPS O-acetylase OafA/YrhL
MASERIRWMDGLRGIAILLVLLCHLYGPPDTVAGSPHSILAMGWTGVELFFLISGFVILMTLERCKSLTEFARRRWLRLFPAMLVGSLIILAYDHFIGVGPFAGRSAADLIPGLVFISPGLIHIVTRVSLNSMDNPYWSLYVEVFFYAVFGTAFFAVGWRAAVGVILVIFACSYGLDQLHLAATSLVARVAFAINWMGAFYFCWFASGALYYRASRGNAKMFWCATALAVIAVFTQKVYVGTTLSAAPTLLVVCALFAGSQKSMLLQRLLSARILVFLGFVSYPLYLIHENICVGLTEILGERFTTFPRWLVPLPPIALALFVSWLIAEYAEPTIRSLFAHRLRKRIQPASA